MTANDIVERGRQLAESGKYRPKPPGIVDIPTDAPRDDQRRDPQPRTSAADPLQGGELLVAGHAAIGNLPAGHYGQTRVIDPPTAPLAVAETVYDDFKTDSALWTLKAWRGGWMLWNTTHWAELDEAQLRAHTYRVLANCTYEHTTKNTTDQLPWNPGRHKIANVIDALAAIAHLPNDIDPPAWIDFRSIHSAAPDDERPQLISCTNGLLDLQTRQLRQHTPAWFNLVSVPFAYHHDCGKPTAWLAFLHSIWDDDDASIMLLQEYMGYLLSGRTHMQKMLLLVGPTRSGKGTIGRLLRKLLGRGHVSGPTLASLGTNFGLSPLLGRPLAIISDARLGKDSSVVVERLLSITGEDTLTVDRKYRDPWTGRLPTRFVILTNELPRFRDASGAIANRMLILQLTESFLGREDHDLDAKLAGELPAILRWALDGLDRLADNDRFTTPKASVDAVTLMMDLASPVSAFTRDRCVREPEATIAVDELYKAWKAWAEDNGHRVGAKSTFGRDLRAVAPELKSTQVRKDDKRVRCHAGIKIRENYNAIHPVHPVPGGETAGQCEFGAAGYPVPDLETAEHGCGPARDDPVPGSTQNRCSQRVARDARAETHSRSNSEMAGSGFGLPTGEGRCPDCGWHTETQGHHGDCPANIVW